MTQLKHMDVSLILESIDATTTAILENGDYITKKTAPISHESFVKDALAASKDAVKAQASNTKADVSNPAKELKKEPEIKPDEVVKVVDSKFEKNADVALSKGKSETVKKGQSAKLESTDKKDTKNPDFDKKATIAAKLGKKNTVDAAVKGPKLDETRDVPTSGSVATVKQGKAKLESLLKECVVHDEYITFMESFKCKDDNINKFVDKAVTAFMESHGTVDKIKLVNTLMESEEIDKVKGDIDVLSEEIDKVDALKAEVGDAVANVIGKGEEDLDA